MEKHSGWNSELETIVREAAIQSGFDLSGIASTEPDAAYALDGERFAAWISAGRAGEMEYLKRRDADGTLLRSDLRVAIPWARSVIICALNYDSDLPRSIDPAVNDAGWIGRYAWSGKRRPDAQGNLDEPERLLATDYHEELLGRLRSVETRLLQYAKCETRCHVDTGPIVERGFAARAGVGWVGKNTCVLNQELGSWLLLGVVVTSLPMLQPLATIAVADRCGSCTRCIDACPTDALVAPREMDASRCIAYLTIEKKGTIAGELRAAMGRQVFGCDICQDVCPWNSRALNRRARNRAGAARVSAGMEPRTEMVNPSLEWLAKLDAQAFKRWFKGSPLERTGCKRLHRNVAIAMGNSMQANYLAQLREWARGDDEVLAEAASWAIERIGHEVSSDGSVC